MFGNTPKKTREGQKWRLFSKVDFLLLKCIGVVDTLQINHWFLGSWILQVWMKRTEKKLQPASSFTLCICIYKYRYAKKWDLVQKNNVKERSQEIPNKLQYIQLQNRETRKKNNETSFWRTSIIWVCCSTLSWPFCFEIQKLWKFDQPLVNTSFLKKFFKTQFSMKTNTWASHHHVISIPSLPQKSPWFLVPHPPTTAQFGSVWNHERPRIGNWSTALVARWENQL